MRSCLDVMADAGGQERFGCLKTDQARLEDAWPAEAPSPVAERSELRWNNPQQLHGGTTNLFRIPLAEVKCESRCGSVGWC
jgi:hypothetical protein